MSSLFSLKGGGASDPTNPDLFYYFVWSGFPILGSFWIDSLKKKKKMFLSLRQPKPTPVYGELIKLILTNLGMKID